VERLNLEECYRDTIDPLSRQEECELIRRYQEEGDMEARERVVQANLRFVIRVAKQFRGCLPLEDAIGEGSLGLLRALDRYDASRGYKFITYAVWWIRQAICEALRHEGHILGKPQALAQVNERFRKASHELEAKRNRYCLESEVLDAMEARDHEKETFMTFRKPVTSTDEHLGRGMNGFKSASRETVGSLYVADRSRQAQTDHAAHQQELAQQLASLLEVLTPRERHVLMLHFGLEGEPPLTLQAIGDLIGLTRERVRQIKEEAFAKLREEPALYAVASDVLDDPDAEGQ
jgi:RNA polymerase primary sigma factor